MGDVLKDMAERAGAGKVLATVITGVAIVCTSLGVFISTVIGLPARLTAVEVAVAAVTDSLAHHKREDARQDSMQDARTAVLVARVVCAIKTWDRNPKLDIEDAMLECQQSEERRKQGLRVNGGIAP